jgi:AraC-like DNA-binding protein
MEELDLMLRGGAAALCLYKAGRWMSIRSNCYLSLFGALFGLSAAIYVVTSQRAAFYDGISAWEPIYLMGKLVAFFFWMFAQALFKDDFRPTLWHGLPALAIALNASLCNGSHEHVATQLALHGMMVLLFGHVLYLGLRDRDGDLVDKRRSFRIGVALSIPLVGFGVIALDLMTTSLPLVGVGALIQSGSVFAVAALIAFWMSRIDDALLPPTKPVTQVHQAKLPAADRLELARLDTAVQSGVLYEPGLTIGQLADRITVPEHRLRKLINQGLGYRNFNAFLNDHRAAEARKRLSDPELAREQIIQHAFALGYASLAPFNRAFRERVGTSPSAFREEALEARIAE